MQRADRALDRGQTLLQQVHLLGDEPGLLQQLPVQLGPGVNGDAAVPGAELLPDLVHVLDQAQT